MKKYLRKKLNKLLICLALSVFFISGCGQQKQIVPADLEDGSYTISVTLGGGTGRVTLENPTVLQVKDGQVYADIIFDSNHYDYMLVDDVRYENNTTNPEDNSSFHIPVKAFDTDLDVIGDTTAMSVPHEISYTLHFDSASIQKAEPTPIGHMETKYATEFAVDYLEGGYTLITVAGSQKYLLVPEDQDLPDDVSEDICVIQQPFEHVYLAATAVMDLLLELDQTDKIQLSGTNEDSWYLPEAKTAMKDGSMLYAGKYSAPDFELLLSKKCDLAMESSMIYHTPDIKEQLEHIGIPVFVDYSSYEEHPLGRLEWIRLYGVLFGEEKAAEAYFNQQEEVLKQLKLDTTSPKTVAFFSVTSSGEISVRKTDDYVTEMIRMGGGSYALTDFAEEENALSTTQISMETFYEQALDADYLIYNSAITGEIETLSQLLDKNALFADFKAVKNHNVWCTGRNMFQESTGIADMILDFNKIIRDEQVSDEELTYLYRLR
ncbi:MAG: ABC transporter substrate-binding protein [Lachnospiraceae bacterium]|nr:ABC transporter substrate-binding protein [Lachnospiraceae bacterium]